MLLRSINKHVAGLNNNTRHCEGVTTVLTFYTMASLYFTDNMVDKFNQGGNICHPMLVLTTNNQSIPCQHNTQKVLH